MARSLDREYVPSNRNVLLTQLLRGSERMMVGSGSGGSLLKQAGHAGSRCKYSASTLQEEITRALAGSFRGQGIRMDGGVGNPAAKKLMFAEQASSGKHECISSDALPAKQATVG